MWKGIGIILTDVLSEAELLIRNWDAAAYLVQCRRKRGTVRWEWQMIQLGS